MPEVKRGAKKKIKTSEAKREEEGATLVAFLSSPSPFPLLSLLHNLKPNIVKPIQNEHIVLVK